MPSVEEMERRIRETLPRYPWLVLAEPEGVRGYAYASAHRQRPGYRWWQLQLQDLPGEPVPPLDLAAALASGYRL